MVAGHLQEKNGYYYMVLSLVNQQGKRKTTWKATGLPIRGNKKKAERMLQEERRKYLSPVISPEQDMLFADFLTYWLRAIKPNVEADTYYGYSTNVEKCIAPYFRERGITLGELRAIHIQDFYAYCSNIRKVSNNTIIHYHANISKALKYAVRMDMILTNSMNKVDRPRLEAHQAQFYTDEEIQQLIRAIHGDGVEFPVLMAAFYGLRRSEIMGLRWRSIDFKNNRITIEHTRVQTRVDGKTVVIAKDRAKNKSSCRSLPLVPQYRELLLQMKAHQDECKKLCGNCWNESGYIYINDIGEPIKPNYVSQHYALVLEKNHLRKITFHELRHSCASLLLANRVPMKEIQAWLGHSDFSTTANIYAHLDVSTKEDTGATMADSIDISGSLSAAQDHGTQMT